MTGPEEREPSATTLKRSAMRSAPLLVVAAVMLALGHRIPALIAVAAAALVAVPVVGEAVGRVTAGVARAAGRGVAVALLAIVQFVVVLPAWVVAKVLRIDPLASHHEPGSTWTRRPTGAEARPRRQFAGVVLAPRVPVAQRAWNVVGFLILLLLVDYAAGRAWDATLGAPPADDAPAGASIGIDVDQFVAASTTTVPPFRPEDGSLTGPESRNWIVPEQAEIHYSDKPWAPELFYDMAQRTFHPYPYLEMKPNPLRTTYINIDGWERKSYRSPGATDDSPEVWFFGGSTTWGVGQRDDHTVPSEVARAAEAAGQPIIARNFGQVAWLNWEEMLLFEQLLADEGPPDAAVFYDGVNEFANPPPFDHPAPRSFTSSLVPAPPPPGDSTSVRSRIISEYRDHSLAMSILDSVRSKLDSVAGADPISGATQDAIGAPGWTEDDEARAAARNYDRGVEIIRGLADRHGVRPVFFWQPRLLQRERHDLVKSHVRSDVIDVSDALDSAPEVYFDDMHTNEDGARLVARRLWEHLSPVIADLDRRAG